MKTYTIVGLGELLWDVLPSVSRIGGAPANFAFHAARFGTRACVVSAVGRDVLGREAVRKIQEAGVESHIAPTEHPTGVVEVVLSEAGVPRYDIKTEVAWDYIPFGDDLRELARRTDAVCFGTLAQRSPVSRQSIVQFLDAMPDDADRLKIFDVNLRAPFFSAESLRAGMERCNVVKLNEDEAPLLKELLGLQPPDGKADSDALSAVGHALLAEYSRLRLVILTLGAAGSYVFTRTVESYQPAPRVKVADTVGAGDAFTAAFCVSLLRNKPIAEAHRIAARVSSYVCSQHGAMPPYELAAF